MAQAIRTLTVEHGLEPGEFVLLAFGGAGPMHAVEIARELGIGEVVVPRFPGAFSAWGMLGTEVRRDLTRQFFTLAADLDGDAMARALAGQEAEALAELAQQGVPEERQRVEHVVDMRYEGQDYTLAVPLLSATEPADEDFLATAAERFAALHERRYGHATPEAPVEFVTLRSTALGALPEAAPVPYAADEAACDTVRQRPVVFGGRSYDTTVLRRERLAPGQRLEGPAVIVEATSTTVVPPDSSVSVDENGFLVIKVGATA